MMTPRSTRLLAATLALSIAALGGPHDARAQAPGDTTAADSAAVAAAASRTRARHARASWTSDRIPLRVGDLLTVVVDEQTASRERVSRVATGTRDKRATLRAVLDATQNNYNIDTGIGGDSRDVGEANRLGDLTAVLTVRVTAIEDGGVATIKGAKKISVDGRMQEIALDGLIRPQDVAPNNTVLSSRIADAVITYKGKKIGPRSGIVGKILEILWP